MTARKPLSEYDEKRDFATSPEPRGELGKQPSNGTRLFCVQKHLASHLHYDFRLEHNGVLMSWAVPKGPSLDPADKRMAVHVEDHPVTYGDFEGVIPDGYGAGIVMLWDRGTWIPEPGTADIDEALKQGELKFSVDGVKLKGSWVLVRTKRPMPGARGEQWLLIKHRDRWAGKVDVTQFSESINCFGGFIDILRSKGTPFEWRKQPPAKGGAAGEMFKVLLSDVQSESTEARQPKAGLAHRKAPPAAAAAAAKPKITNPKKVLFPLVGFTKGNLVDYYTRIAPFILPHLAGRAVTFKRYPDGVNGSFFFEKRCPEHRPPWVNTVRLSGEPSDGKSINYCTIDSVQALQWAANLAAIELHVPLARAAAPDTPTALIFDLDPGTPARLKDCVRIGLRLKMILDELGLSSLPKFSGGKGLHVLVPLNLSNVTFEQTKSFARAVALTLQRDDPKHVTAVMAKQQREGRVFVDWGQNDRDKTNACIFSVRAGERPNLSWPVDWKSLTKMKLAGPPNAQRLPRTAALNRICEQLDLKQTLPKF